MRYEHFLEPVQSTALPQQAIAIEAEAEIVDHPVCKDVQIELLTSWHAVCWSSGAERPRKDSEESGRDAASFWRLCERLMRRGVVTWVFALPASRILGLLDFWGELEAGRIYLSERDARDDFPGESSTLSSLRQRQDKPTHTGGTLPNCGVPVLRHSNRPALTGAQHQQKPTRKRPLGYCVLEDPPTIVQCRRKGRAGSLRIVDLRNYGCSGGEAPNEARARIAWIKETVLAMCRVLKENDLGGLQNTASSQAFTTLKKRFLTDSIMVHCDAEALHLERLAYYGGRTEAKRIGVVSSRVFSLDFRGFYTSLGATMALPVRLVGYTESPGTAAVLSEMAIHGAIAHCGITTDEPCYPLRRKADTIYPVGRFSTYLAGPELRHALERDRVTEIHSAAYFEMAPACAEYAKSLAALRAEAEYRGDSAGAEYLKRLGVSLYGKFCQTSAYWVDTTERLADHPYHCWCEVDAEGNLVRWRAMGWEVQREHKYYPGDRPEKGTAAYERWRRTVLDREAGESCPAIGAYVTSQGRLLLWSAICAAGHEHVYYYDTDSLFVSEQGLANLYRANMVGSGEQGRLSIRAVIDKLTIHGVKYYEADGQVTCSGMPKGERMPGPDKDSYYLRAWLGRNLNSGIRPTVDRVRRLYERTAKYHQGFVRSDGRIEPWKVG